VTEREPTGRRLPTEEQYQARLWKIFDWADATQALLSEGELLPHPERRSPMEVDNRRTHPLEIAHSVHTLITVAVEHLHALAALIRKARVLHNSPPFTLCRSSIEAAATAVWMLQPTDWRERVRRLVIYQRQDRHDYEVAARLVQERTGGALPSTLAQRKDWLNKIVEANGITDLPRFSITQVIVEVDKGKGSKHFETYWRIASGFAHGRQWSQLNALVRSEPVPIGPGVAAARVENDMGRVHWGTAAAYELTQTAISSYRDACRAPRNPQRR
jgi:hypothetical protein